MQRDYRKPEISIHKFKGDAVITASADISQYIDSMKTWIREEAGEARLKQFSEILSFIE